MKTKVLFVLGMHRSGTSCLAKCLHNMGLSFTLNCLGDTPYSNHMEYPQVVQINDQIIGSWKRPVLKRNFLFRKIFEYKIKYFIKKAHKGNEWVGIKDPRFVFTIDYWLKSVSSFKIIAIFRRPGEVARSLEARGSGYGYLPYDDALKLWILSNKYLLNLYYKYRFPVMNFNVPKEEFGRRLKIICDIFGFPFSWKSFNETFIEKERHHVSQDIPKECLDIYMELTKLYQRFTGGVNG